MARRHRSREGPLAIASGSVRRLVTRTLEALGITDWFAAVVAAEDTARHKPEPDVFLEAARRLGVDPAACTVYEDTDIGLEAARRAGMTPVDVRPLIRGARRRLTLRQPPSRALPPPIPKNAAIFERSWFFCAAVGHGRRAAASRPAPPGGATGCR